MKQLFLILALMVVCPFIQAKPLAVEESYYRYKDELGIQAKEQAIYSLKGINLIFRDISYNPTPAINHSIKDVEQAIKLTKKAAKSAGSDFRAPYEDALEHMDYALEELHKAKKGDSPRYIKMSVVQAKKAMSMSLKGLSMGINKKPYGGGYNKGYRGYGYKGYKGGYRGYRGNYDYKD